jgi:hypothetical protein
MVETGLALKRKALNTNAKQERDEHENFDA